MKVVWLKLYPPLASFIPCTSISLLIDLLLLFHRDVKPIEHQLRPRGLGLGADRSAIKDLEPNKHQRPPKPGEERAKEEELVMGPGGCVLVESGAHKDLYGKVELIWSVLASIFIIADMQLIPTEVRYCTHVLFSLNNLS